MLWIRNCPLICRGSRIHPWYANGERIHPWYATENESTPGMLRITNPPLVCHGSRISCSVVKLLVLEKNQPGTKSSEKVWITKNLENGNPKKKHSKPKENQVFFLAATFSRISVIQFFFDEIGKKTKKWKPIFYGDRLYAEENDAMLRRTIPPLVCSGAQIHPWYVTDHESTPGIFYGSRIHPWYAKDHECQQLQNSPTHVGYGS